MFMAYSDEGKKIRKKNQTTIEVQVSNGCVALPQHIKTYQKLEHNQKRTAKY